MEIVQTCIIGEEPARSAEQITRDLKKLCEVNGAYHKSCLLMSYLCKCFKKRIYTFKLLTVQRFKGASAKSWMWAYFVGHVDELFMHLINTKRCRNYHRQAWTRKWLGLGTVG